MESIVDYTETVYRENDGDYMCRILNEVTIKGVKGSEEGILVVDMYGDKIVFPTEYFQSNFFMYDAGETPAALIQKDEDGNN